MILPVTFKKRVKAILAENSKKYSKEDFIEFKKLFDTLNEINNIGKQLQPQPQPQPQDISNEEGFLPIYGIYKKKTVKAHYDLNSKKVVYNNSVGSSSAMANQAVWNMGAPKTSARNGLLFWKDEKGKALKEINKIIDK